MIALVICLASSIRRVRYCSGSFGATVSMSFWFVMNPSSMSAPGTDGLRIITFCCLIPRLVSSG